MEFDMSERQNKLQLNESEAYLKQVQQRLEKEMAKRINMLFEKRWKKFNEKREGISSGEKMLAKTWIQADSPAAKKLGTKLDKPLGREYSLAELLKRPELDFNDIAGLLPEPINSLQAREQLEIAARYSGYIERQKDDIAKLKANENTLIPGDFDFSRVNGLSNEVKQKLTDAKPHTLGRAGRVPGVTPAAISLLLIYLKKTGLLKKSA